MAKRNKISHKAQIATDRFIANTIIAPIVGYTWSQAMRDAGYAEKTIDRTSGEVLGRLGVMEQIGLARAKIAIKAETARDEALRMFRRGYEIAEKQGNPSGISCNAVGFSRVFGLLTDNISAENKVLGINVVIKE